MPLSPNRVGKGVMFLGCLLVHSDSQFESIRRSSPHELICFPKNWPFHLTLTFSFESMVCASCPTSMRPHCGYLYSAITDAFARVERHRRRVTADGLKISHCYISVAFELTPSTAIDRGRRWHANAIGP